MKEIEFKITEKGVKTHVRLKCRKLIVTDIDIDDDVDTLIFGINENETNFELRDVNKVFPNVTKFFIMPNVQNIKVSNNMFPNVRYVASFNKRYETCSMLVSQRHLLNSFCLKEDEVLDLNNIRYVDDYALEGCYATDIKCYSGVIFSSHGIDNSRYANEPFVDGIKRYKNIIVDIDETTQDVILHKDDILDYYVFGNRKLKSLQISNINQLNFLDECLKSGTEVTINKLIIDVDAPVERFNLMRVADNILSLEDIVISDNVQNLASIDGVLYSKRGKTLYYVPQWRTRDLIVPEGVITVVHHAAQGTRIPSVTFPKSLQKIENNAFGDSHIISAKFQNSDTMVIIESNAFQNCKKLEEVILPRIGTLYSYTFYNCIKLSKIAFCEGIKNIRHSAFGRCNSLRDVEFPASLEAVEAHNFAYVEKITLKGQDLISGLSRLICITKSNISYLILNFMGKNMYIPRDFSLDLIREICEGKICGYYNLSNITKIKQDTAVAEYFEYRQPDLKKYIRRSSKSIVERYFESDLYRIIIKLIDCDLVSGTTLDYIIEEAEKRNLTTLKAYALDKIQNCTKTGFNL